MFSTPLRARSRSGCEAYRLQELNERAISSSNLYVISMQYRQYVCMYQYIYTRMPKEAACVGKVKAIYNF